MYTITKRYVGGLARAVMSRRRTQKQKQKKVTIGVYDVCYLGACMHRRGARILTSYEKSKQSTEKYIKQHKYIKITRKYITVALDKIF